MCRPKENGGRRCNAHTPYGVRHRNLQAKKQYHARELENGDLSTNRIAKHEAALAKTLGVMHELEAKKEALGTVKPFVIPLTPATEKVLNRLREAGFQPYLVGGGVRDALMGLVPKDMDIEVYGGSAELVSNALAPLGRVDEVGKSFGVLKIRVDNEEFDVSLPRKDSKTGDHHRDFEVEVNPDLSLEEATARRDYTINALMYDHALGFIVDKHGGLKDLEHGYLRHVSDAFDEDPLRVLRGVQMAARFDMQLHPATIEKAATLRESYKSLAVERVQMEFQKLYEKGQNFNRAVDALQATSWDGLFPGLADADTEQLKSDLARSQKLLRDGALTGHSREKLIGAVFASAIAEKQRLKFLSYTTVSTETKQGAYQLTVIEGPEKSAPALRRWVHELPRQISPRDWLTYQRLRGNEAQASAYESQFKSLNIMDGPEPDLLNGNDVMAHFADRKPGPWMAQLLRAARGAQYDESFRDRTGALNWLATQTA